MTGGVGRFCSVPSIEGIYCLLGEHFKDTMCEAALLFGPAKRHATNMFANFGHLCWPRSNGLGSTRSVAPFLLQVHSKLPNAGDEMSHFRTQIPPCRAPRASQRQRGRKSRSSVLSASVLRSAVCRTRLTHGLGMGRVTRISMDRVFRPSLAVCRSITSNTLPDV